MSLSTIVDDEVASCVWDEVAEKKRKGEWTEFDEHDYELRNTPAWCRPDKYKTPKMLLADQRERAKTTEPSTATTTTTTTGGDGIPYTMQSRFSVEKFPGGKITHDHQTGNRTLEMGSLRINDQGMAEIKADVSMAGDIIPDDESKPNTTATTVTTTSSATADTNPSLLMMYHREGTKTEAVCQELQDTVPGLFIFSSNMLQYLKENDLPARFEDPVSGGIGAPVATTVVVASTPTETKSTTTTTTTTKTKSTSMTASDANGYSRLVYDSNAGVFKRELIKAVPTETKAPSETEEFYAALDKERSAWKQGPLAPWSRWHFDAHLLRPWPTPQDEEAMRKVGLPPLGWMCTTCSRYFDYPSTMCAHAWRPCWSGGGPTVEEVD